MKRRTKIQKARSEARKARAELRRWKAFATNLWMEAQALVSESSFESQELLEGFGIEAESLGLEIELDAGEDDD